MAEALQRTRACTRCRAAKSPHEFSLLRRGKPYLKSECKPCVATRTRAWNVAHLEHRRAYMRRYMRARYQSRYQPRVELVYPYQVTEHVEGFDLVNSINNLVPRSLPEAVRADVCQALALSVLSGEVTTPNAEQVRACVREQFRFLPSRFHISLDADEYVKNRLGHFAAQLASSWGATYLVR